MTKKKNTKKKTAKKNTTKRPKKVEMVSFLVRTHPDVKAWLEETAADNGLSRDAFLRLLFSTARATWEEHDDVSQRDMFDTLASSIDQSVQRAVDRALASAPTNQIRRRIKPK